MKNIEYILSKLSLTPAQIFQVQKNIKILKEIKSFVLTERVKILIALCGVQLSEEQKNIAEQYEFGIINSLKFLNNKCVDVTFGNCDEDAALAYCYIILNKLNNGIDVNFDALYNFIVANFERLNKYKVYSALMFRYVTIKEANGTNAL